MSRDTVTVTLVDDDGEKHEHVLPGRNEVCERCDGHGTHLRPSIGEHAYTREEFDEAFDDEESRAEYFKRGGIYDVTCEECGGNRVVMQVDEDRLTPAQRPVFEQYLERQEQEARWDADDRHTRRMESGGY